MVLTSLEEDLTKQQAITDDVNAYIWKHTIEPLLNDRLIDEHAGNPLGKHSPALDMILAFLRSDPVPSKPRLVVVILELEETWAIGEHPREKGVPVRVRPETYDSVEEVEHAVFLERLKDAQEVYS